MRPIVIGLIAAFVAATILPQAAFAATAPAAAAAPKGLEITADARNQGKKEAPALIAAANLPCQISDARFIGQAEDPKTKAATKYYEVACTGSIGYIVVDKGKGQTPGWASCLDQAKVDPVTGKPNGAACYLPANLDDKASLAPFIAKTKVACDPSQVRGVGHSDQSSYFEVLCTNGFGYILSTTAPPKLDGQVQIIPCLNFDASSPVSCKLTTNDQQLALITAMGPQMSKPCQITGAKYMLTTQDFDNYYEVACADKKGYVLHLGPEGKVKETIDCAVADQIGNGCTLTNSREAQTEEKGLYTKLAQKAGFSCNVSKYGPINANIAQHEVVELACDNRTDGAVAIFPAVEGQPAVIYDCAHSELAGYRCSFSSPDAAFPHLTADLAKLGKTSCVVSGERTVGTSEADHVGYLEVACADGNPGYMISYNMPAMTPKETIACASAKSISGGCQLPTNQLKH